MPEIELPAAGWRPRFYQHPLWDYLEKGGKRAVAIWHRRAGKDDIALHRAAIAAFERPGVYWHMLPEYAQARKAIWNAVDPHTSRRRINAAFPQELRETTRDQDMLLRFKNGSTWQVVGSDSFNSLVGSPPVGVVFSEYAIANPAAWAYIRPILAENDGWALFIATPRGMNHAFRLYDEATRDLTWFAQCLPATETGVFSPETLEREKAELVREYGREQGLALFDQEYLCSFEAAILGAFYAEALRHMADRIVRLPVERTIPVHTGWDLGVTDSTAIWFVQVVGREMRLVDYYEANGMGLDHYVRYLADWREKHGITWGNHYLPHDVQHHELSTGQSRVATLHGLGLSPVVVPQHAVMDGINATRRMLERAWIDPERCARGLEALRHYRREWDEVNRTFRPKPKHDFSSHGADALRTFAAGHVEPTLSEPRRRYSMRTGRGTGSTSWLGA